jgi:hypothetical protein
VFSWSSLRNLLDARISTAFMIIGTASPVAYLFEQGIKIKNIEFLYVGWSLIIAAYFCYKLTCPSICIEFLNNTDYYRKNRKYFESNKGDSIYEFSFLYEDQFRKKVKTLTSSPKDIFEHSESQNISIFGFDKYVFYALHLKFDYQNFSKIFWRFLISCLVLFGFTLVQIPAIKALYVILKLS